MSDGDGPVVTDLALLTAARAGDSVALGTLMERFRNYLLRVASDDLNPLLRPKVRSSDVVQETFLEAYRLFDRFDGDQAEQLLVWMRGILHNKMREAVAQFLGTAKRNPNREVGLDGAGDGPDVGPSPSTDASRREQAMRVLAAVDRLPAEYQQVIRWRTWDGLSFAEIGERGSRSEDAARMLFARALKRLEEELSDGSRPPSGPDT